MNTLLRITAPSFAKPFHRRGAVVALNCLLAVAIAGLPACGGGGGDTPQESTAADDAKSVALEASFTAQELTAVAVLAREEGQVELAENLEVMTASQGNHQPMVWGIVLKAAKKALILALRHGGPPLAKLVRKLSPKAGKVVESRASEIANVLEQTTVWEEAVLSSGLIHIGIDPVTAREIARWVVMFLG